MDKSILRRQMLSLREGILPNEVEEKSQEIRKRLFSLPEFQRAKTVMFYLSKDKEVKTEEMVRSSLRLTKTVVVPLSRVKERDILPCLLTSLDRELARGAFGILEPRPEGIRPVRLEEIELVIVPGIAFNKRGDRIGFGGGFYDNFLSRLPEGVTRIGLSFEQQMVKEIPTGKKDEPVDKIITENRIYDCKGWRKTH